ncbi:MAG: efflux RND transporter permease subunit [Fidelibacterota bacterium]|nr:MAG: efflux RND transporter permease subunit [Candidatus Neomarinimicrobiota bacterium]
MKGFFRFFAQRHILANLITLMTILLGLSTLASIKRDIYPSVVVGIMSITTTYPGASPEDVELNVTNKIEGELKNVTGIERVVSVSMENVSLINAFIDIDVSDEEKVKSEIREAVNRVTDLPAEVTEAPQVVDMRQMTPVIEVGISSELPYRELREQARLLEKKLKSVSGVSHLTSYGYRAREVRVQVSPDALSRYQIPMREIIAAIRARNIRGTTGTFESYTSEKNLVTLAQFRDAQEVGDVIVRSTFDGPVIRVKDLAVISDDFADEKMLSRMNGQAAISFIVWPRENADVIRTSDAVKAMVEQERERLSEGVEIHYATDMSRTIRNSFNVVLRNGLVGLVLVCLLLTVFLNLRTAFWVALGIPVTLLGLIFLLPLFGSYLDTITLAGMILVIGIIVDDAIIIAENISKRRELGDEPLDAAVTGLYEVYRPVVTTVLTTLVVFAPMFFMPGVFGKYVVVIPLAISLALIISLVEATAALPAHLIPRHGRGPRKTASRRWFNALRERYREILPQFLRFRYPLVGLSILLLMGTLWYAGRYMKFIMFPADLADQFGVIVELPTGTSLRATADKVRDIEALLEDLPEEEMTSYVTRIGSINLFEAVSENYAAIMVNLSHFSERSRNADQIVEGLRKQTDELAGFEQILYTINTGGPPVGKPISIRIVGSDDARRAALADTVERFLAAIEGVKDIARDDELGKDQVEIQIDYDQLSRLGLTVADVAQNVRIAYDGEVVTSVRYGEEDVDFRVMIAEAARQELDYLTELRIPNREGRLIPLREVAILQIGPGQADFRHFDGERTVTVEADVDQAITTPVEATQAVFDHFNLDDDWPGLRFLVGGEVFETEESVAGLLRTMILAVIGVYFLLVLLFNSLTQPVLVMIAIPFGIIGVIVAFALHGDPLTFTAMLGIIGLSGVVVNDSLVLVNHINDLKRKRREASIKDLVAEGTVDRLRAVIMTTLTTVVGLLPLAYGLGGTDAFMAPMAMAMGWGLFFATPLTLVLVPCLYMIGQDIHRLVKRVKGATTEE